MKICNITFSFILTCFLSVSCTQGLDYQDEKEIPLQDTEAIENDGLTLTQKFENIQERGKSVMTRSIDVNNSDFNLVSFKHLKKISSTDELEQIKLQILSDESIFPYYDLDNSQIRLLSMNEIKQSKQYDQIQYSKSLVSR